MVASSAADGFAAFNFPWRWRVLDTNLNLPRIVKLLRVAVAAANLKWGNDLPFFWRQARLVRPHLPARPGLRT